MNIDSTIDALAARNESVSPVVSLYLDTSGGDGAQRDRVRILMKQELQNLREALGADAHPPTENVERAIERIEQYLKEEVDPATRGVAIFATADDELFEAIELKIPVRSELFIGSRPHVRQLFEIREARPRLIVALVDARSARLVELEMGEVIGESNLSNDWETERVEGEGPPSDAQTEDHLRHFLKEVAAELDAKVREREPEGVILSGLEKTRSIMLDLLSQPVRSTLLDPIHLDIRASHDEVIEKAEKQWNLQNSDLLTGEMKQIEALAEGDGKAAVGFSGVIRAANERRLDRVLISEEASGRGWKCPNCSLIGEKIPLGCPSCGSDVVTVDLVEQLISAARSEKARVRMHATNEVLERHDGVAALLRF